MLLPLGYYFHTSIDGMYSTFFKYVGQLIVVPFLFYSGYGIVEKIKEDPKYILTFATHRILPLYLNFIVALVCYIFIWFLAGGVITPYKLLKSIFLQFSFGNPTWFLFATFYLYVVTVLVFRWCSRRMYRAMYLIMLCAVYMYCMRSRPTFWYNTIFAYAYGAVVSMYKQNIGVFVERHFKGIMIICALLFVFLKALSCDMWGIIDNLAAIAFISVVVLVTCKFKISNPVIRWTGSHVFPIYMYHLLFFFAAKCLLSKPINSLVAHIAVVVTFIMTCLTAYFFKFWRIRSISWHKNLEVTS